MEISDKFRLVEVKPMEKKKKSHFRYSHGKA